MEKLVNTPKILIRELFSFRLLLSIILIIGFLPESGAQSYFKINWEKTYNSNTNDKVIYSGKSSDGNLVLFGETNPPESQGTKILFLKISLQGNTILKKVLGKKYNYNLLSAIESISGGFYILCSKLEDSGNALICLMKTDNDGNIVWESTTGGAENEMMTDLVETKDNGIFLCGYKEIKGDRDTDAWLIKFNRKGSVESQALFGSRYTNDAFKSIISDNKGGYVISGYTSAKIGGEKIPYVLNVDFRGNKIWEKSYSAFERNEPGSIFINKDGLIICLNNEFSSTNGFKNVRKLILNPLGEVVGNYGIEKRLNIQKNSYVQMENDELLMMSAVEKDPSIISDRFLIRLENNLKPLWIKPVDTKNAFLSCLNKINNDNFLASGWISSNSYNKECLAFQFQDNSGMETDKYIKERLVSIAKMNDSESESDFINRIGKPKYDSYYSQFKTEASEYLKLLPQSFTRDVNQSGDSRPSIIVSSKKGSEDTGEPVLKGNYYALLIAINDYKDPLINNLDKPISDAQRLFDILVSDYMFEKANVTFLKNPTREQIISSLDRLERELRKEDNLIIFYAGHGYWNEVTQKGYWLASDASKQNTANWIGNSTISDYIRSIQCRHTLLVADACFSGSIFKTRSAFGGLDKSSQKLYELTSRKAMTSGTLTEVPDKSIFVEYLVRRLADNSDKFLAAEQLFFSFKPAVLNNTENIPQFGVVANTGDEGGDFIFIKRAK